MKLGQTLSGLLNASFGNAVEIIVGIAALLQGSQRHKRVPPPIAHSTARRTSHRADLCTWAFTLLYTVVLTMTQLLGSILSNILLVLGCSFLAGMWRATAPCPIASSLWKPEHLTYRWPEVQRELLPNDCGASVSASRSSSQHRLHANAFQWNV